MPEWRTLLAGIFSVEGGCESTRHGSFGQFHKIGAALEKMATLFDDRLQVRNELRGEPEGAILQDVLSLKPMMRWILMNSPA
jgi:hypothetical protein